MSRVSGDSTSTVPEQGHRQTRANVPKQVATPNGVAKMARRSDRDSGGSGLKFTVWAGSILIAVWAGHDPHQAAMVVHSIAAAIASHAAHH